MGIEEDLAKLHRIRKAQADLALAKDAERQAREAAQTAHLAVDEAKDELRRAMLALDLPPLEGWS